MPRRTHLQHRGHPKSKKRPRSYHHTQDSVGMRQAMQWLFSRTARGEAPETEAREAA